MSNGYAGKERRRFLRCRHETTIRYKILDQLKSGKTSSRIINAISKNLSGAGILFSSKVMPEISSILVMELDYRTAQVCREIEENALILNNSLFGKVVRIEDTDDGLYDIGVAFIKKTDELSETIKEIMGKIRGVDKGCR